MQTKTRKIPKILTAAAVLSFASGSFAAGYYLPPASFKLDGENPRFGVIGDFNADGIDDLAAVFPIPDKITGALTTTRINFLVGNSAGTMKIETTFGLPFNVLSMAMGDFNGDGKPDLAVAQDKADGVGDPYCGTQKGVVIFFGLHNEGQPDLQFADCIRNLAPAELWTLDANGDNQSDLIIGTQLLLSNGDGTFTTGDTVPEGDKLITDVNGDSHPDVVTDSQAVCGDGNGGFVSCALPPNDPLVATDAQGDIVTRNTGTTSVRNKAALPFSRQVAADIDGDGISDLVGAVVTSLETPVKEFWYQCSWGYHVVNVYRPGAGRGRSRTGGSYSRRGKWLYSCQTSNRPVPGWAYATVVQRTEIPGMSALRITLIRPDGSVDQVLGPEIHGYFRALQVADVNEDGHPDVLASIGKVAIDGRLRDHPDYPGMVVFTGNGDGTFNPPESTGLSLDAAIPGDFNGDGLIDFGHYVTPIDSEHLLAVAFHNPPTTPAAPVPDTVPPSVAFTSPGGGATVSGTVQLAASASDNIGVASVTFQAAGNIIGQVATAPYQVSWDTSVLTPGNYTLQVVATDAAGNSSTASIGVTVAAPSSTSTPSPVSTTAQPTGNQAEFAGSVTEVGADYFVVDGVLRVSIGTSSILKYQDGFGPAPKVGDPVQGKADEYSDGRYVLVKAEFG